MDQITLYAEMKSVKIQLQKFHLIPPKCEIEGCVQVQSFDDIVIREPDAQVQGI